MRILPCLLLSFFLLSAPVFSIQSKNKHWRSLRRIELEERIKKEKNYKDRIDLLNLLAYKLSYYDHDTALKKSHEALKVARGHDSSQIYKMGIVDSLNNLGLIYTLMGNLEEAKKYYDKAKMKAEFFKNKVGQAEAYIGLYRYYQLKGQYETAYSRLLKSQVILDTLKGSDDGLRERAKANQLHGLGVIYFYDKDSSSNKNNYKQSYNNFLECLRLREKAGDLDEIGITYYSLGEALQEQGKYEEAKVYFNKAEEIARKTNNSYIIANVRQSMGDISKKKHKKFTKALEYYMDSLKQFEEIGDKFQIASLKMDIGACLVTIKKYKEAEPYLVESLKLADDIENAHTIKSVAEELAEVYKMLGNEEKRIKYSEVASKQKKLMDEFSTPSLYEKMIQTKKEAWKRQLLLFVVLISLFFLAIVFWYFIKAKRSNTKLEKSLEDLQLLDTIGKDIISSLTVDNIIDKVYQSVNNVMDATVFGICIFNPEKKALDSSYKEKGKNLPVFSFYLNEKERMAVYCFEKQEKIKTDDYTVDYKKYSNTKPVPKEGETFLSHIFLPLTLSLEDNKTKKIGVITVQSPKVKAYSDYHVTMLDHIANYAAIALNNADAMQKIEEQTHQLKKSLEKEKELGALKDQFMYTLSHQYKTPLTTIDLACQYLDKYIPEVTEEEIRRRVNKVMANVNRLKALLDKLLLHSKPFNPDIHDLEDICRETVKEIKERKETRHQIDFHSSESIPEAFVDKELVKIMLNNLLTNSIKYSEETTTICVELKKQNNHGIIRVIDQGRGIPEEFLNLKDKRFHRGDNVSDTEGTGLGLSIVERYIQLHGGTINYKSRLNEGTTLTIALPIENRMIYK